MRLDSKGDSIDSLLSLLPTLKVDTDNNDDIFFVFGAKFM